MAKRETAQEKATRVFDYISLYAYENGKMPNRREICETLRISPKALPALYGMIDLSEVRELVRDDERGYTIPDEHSGDDVEYPYYAEDDMLGVKSPGYGLERPWSDVVGEGGDDDGDEWEVEMSTEDNDLYKLGKLHKSVPGPATALEQFRRMAGMERFTEKERDVLILHRAAMMTIPQIAKYLGITKDAAESTLRRAFAKCDK